MGDDLEKPARMVPGRTSPRVLKYVCFILAVVLGVLVAIEFADFYSSQVELFLKHRKIEWAKTPTPIRAAVVLFLSLSLAVLASLLLAWGKQSGTGEGD